MTTWQFKCRHALEAALTPVAALNSVPMQVNKLPLNPKPEVRWLRFSNHYGLRRIIEMGPTPRIEAPGFAKIGIFTRIADGEDANDVLAGIVADVYPYNTTLTFDGLEVTVSTVDKGDAVPDEQTGWLYSFVDVNWTVWRT